MTITSTTDHSVGIGNGGTTVFSYNFLIPNATSVTITYTDAAGAQTVLTSAQYSITGIGVSTGGTVTYPLIGSPIAAGTTLLIRRAVPYVQLQSFENQGPYLPSSTEAGFDYAMMALQQVQGNLGYAIVANPSNTVAPAPLPPAASAAGKALIFDSTGNNVIAGTALATGTVSTAMQPVIAAATLALGRTALGLGAMAVEGIGAGLQDNGAGSVRVTAATVADTVSSAVTSAYHFTDRIATGPITYTLPKASTLWNGFGFWIYAYTGTVTVAIDAGDSFVGQSAGVSLSLSAGSVAFITTNGTLTWYPRTITSASTQAASAPQGRLTLTSATPVPAANVSAATTVYYTPARGAQVPIWNGTQFVSTPFTETSQLLTDTTFSPAGAVANTCYDYFAWSSSGTIRVTRGPAWTNTTTRGYTLTNVSGFLTNTSAITNGPQAGYGTYVGTIVTDTGSAAVSFSRGGAGSGGLGAFLNVWNMYNRVLVAAKVTDNGAGYAYASATVRQARASAGNQISFVAGQQEDSFQANYGGTAALAVAVGNSVKFGIGIDSTTALSSPGFLSYVESAAIAASGACAVTSGPLLGAHYISALESSPAASSNTFDVSSDNQLSAMFRM